MWLVILWLYKYDLSRCDSTGTTSAQPSRDKATVGASGLFSYTPDIDCVGNDTFTYTICGRLRYAVVGKVPFELDCVTWQGRLLLRQRFLLSTASAKRQPVLTDQPIRDPLTGGQPRFIVQAYSLAARRGLRVLLVGRRATSDSLAAIVAAREMMPHGKAVESGNENDGQELAPRLLPLELVTLTNQKMALQEIRVQPPKVVLVELEDKPESRRRFCDMIRYRLPTAVIFAVSMAKPQTTFVFDGTLNLPLRAEEVWAALLGVQEEVGDFVLQRGPIRLNVATRTVISVNGQRHMTPKQCALLQYLMLRTNEVVSRREIMEAIWETNYLEDTRTLDVHIRWLRECIEPDPSTPVYLLTERGQGYYLKIPT